MSHASALAIAGVAWYDLGVKRAALFALMGTTLAGCSFDGSGIRWRFVDADLRSPDGAIDARMDLPGDGAREEGAGDSARETTAEAGEDLIADLPPDLGEDQSVDIAPDIAPDVTPDVAPDVTPDITPDVTPDQPVALTCSERYHAVPGVHICGPDDDTATCVLYYAQGYDTTCLVICGIGSGACLDGWNNQNNSNGRCTKSGQIGCYAWRSTSICECTR